MHKLILPVFLFSLLTMGLLATDKVLAWQTEQSASTECSANSARIDWWFTNKESNRDINLEVKDTQTNKQSQAITVSPNETITGSFLVNGSINDGVVNFALIWTDDTKQSETKTADYQAIECKTDDEPTEVLVDTTPVNDNLPNTGPLASIGVFSALTAASFGAWYTTRKEVFKALKK